MKLRFIRQSTATIVLLCSLVTFAMPFVAAAQGADLNAAIRAEIMKDPRSAGIPAAQIDAMVVSLAKSAQEQGLSASDVSWKPAAAVPVPVIAQCDFFCNVNNIFGFGSGNYFMSIALGLTSALLVLIIALMLHRHHMDEHEAMVATQPPYTPAK